MEIVRVSIEDLIPDPDNARHHPEENLEAIRKSLKRFGQVAPLVVHQATAVVVSGNGTLEAMKRLGWSECDVVVYSGTKDEATALGLAMNRSGESSRWTGEKLETLIKELAAADFQGLEALGFDEKLIADLVSGDATVDALIDVSGYQRRQNGEEGVKPATMADRFGVPPFSVLDARQGYWQDRKRAWLALGIKSEIGRGDNCLDVSATLAGIPEGAEREREMERSKAFKSQGRLNDYRREREKIYGLIGGSKLPLDRNWQG